MGHHLLETFPGIAGARSGLPRVPIWSRCLQPPARPDSPARRARRFPGASGVGGSEATSLHAENREGWLLGRWLAITAGLVSAQIVVASLIERHYGKQPATRFRHRATGLVLMQQTLLLFALPRGPGGFPNQAQPLDLVDALTLSRGGVAAMIAGLVSAGVRDRAGLAGWLSWPCFLASVTLFDWIDGPLARRRGPTPLGRVLDIEIDSWLSLVGDFAGAAWGGLPHQLCWPSLGRYLLPAASHHYGRYAEAVAIGTTWWARGAGIAHAAAVVIALAPFGGRFASRFAWALAALAGAAQLGCLAVVLVRICTPKPSHHGT
jgi:phosphatidylglycerophosphate synthase